MKRIRIIETNLKFGGLTVRSKTVRVIIHHSASADVPASTVHDWHSNKGWSGIGYHFVGRANGTIERGRPETMIGAHAEGHNSDSLGYLVTGNFEVGKPTKEQIDSLVWFLTSYVPSRYGRRLPETGHGDVMATLCPGKNFPWTELRKRLGGAGVSANTPTSWAKEAWVWAKAQGLLDGTRPKDNVTREELAVILQRISAK